MEYITNKQVYDIYIKQDDKSRNCKVSTTVSILEDQCKMANVEWVLSSKRHHRESKVNTIVDKRQGMSKKSRADIEAWENLVFVKLRPLENPSDIAVSTGKRGRPQKRLSENPGDKTSNKLLDDLLNNLTCVADEQNISTSTLLRALSDR